MSQTENDRATTDPDRWAPYVARYRGGEWRDRIFRDLVVEDARRRGDRPTVLDIGCGRGLDDSVPLQRSVADAAGRYVGIEPDPEIPLGDYFTEIHRCTLQEAPIDPGSVDVAFAVMVLEHLPEPQSFWDKLHRVLADGGVFWGLTVDARHPFRTASLCIERVGLKNIYLRLLYGSGGYENYPTYYRSNHPDAIARLAREYSQVETISFARRGQWSPYFPRPLRPIVDYFDERAVRKGRPGTLLAVRVVK